MLLSAQCGRRMVVLYVCDILREFLGHNFVSGLRTLKPKNLKKSKKSKNFKNLKTFLTYVFQPWSQSMGCLLICVMFFPYSMLVCLQSLICYWINDLINHEHCRVYTALYLLPFTIGLVSSSPKIAVTCWEADRHRGRRTESVQGARRCHVELTSNFCEERPRALAWAVNALRPPTNNPRCLSLAAHHYA